VGVVADGTVADRPWGRTFAALGLRGFTGQLTLVSDTKRFHVAFQAGAVVAATSPLASDAAVRMALTSGLLSSSQVADIARRQAAAPDRDEVDLIAELARLGPDHGLRLRRRVIAQRAARTFSIEKGEFTLDDQIKLPLVPGTELDVRSVIYFGARQNLAEARLDAEVAAYGAWFRLRADAVQDLPQYGFSDAERVVLEKLSVGADLSELEQLGVEVRAVRAMVYALASCSACEVSHVAARRPASTPPQTRAPTSPPARASDTSPPPSGQRRATAQLPTVDVTPRRTTSGSMAAQPDPTAAQTEAPRATGPSSQPPPVRVARTATAIPVQAPARPQTPATQAPNIARPPPAVGSPIVPRPAAAIPAQPPPSTTPRATRPQLPRAGTPREPDEDTDPNATIPVPPSDPSPGAAAAARATRTARLSIPAGDGLDAPTLARIADEPATFRRSHSSTPPLGAPGSGLISIPEPEVDVTIRRRLPTSRPPANASTRAKVDTAQAADIKRLIQQRLEHLTSGIDHFQLLGVSHDVSAADLRKAYFALARQLHPDRLSALGIVDEHRDAQRLFAQVNTAFSILSDSKRRSDYTAIVRRGGEAAMRAEQARAEEMATRILDGEEAFRRGEMALRRDQIATAIGEFARAIELNPEEADYHALHAWAQFCASPDKVALATATRTTLERTIARAPRAIAPRFYLGRVERMLGRDRDALKHFQDVLAISPHHTEATSEARVIEARLTEKPPSGGGGLFGRKR
jgi:hypothetical protein